LTLTEKRRSSPRFSIVIEIPAFLPAGFLPRKDAETHEEYAYEPAHEHPGEKQDPFH
jgi:hypothetical protein